MDALKMAASLLGALSLVVLLIAPMNSPAKAPALEKPALTGKVTLDGDRPDVAKLAEAIREAMRAKDEEHCLAKDASEDEKTYQGWRIDDSGGVANVFVWIVPKKGEYFKIDMEKKTWADEVKLEQPHCAFIPHCMVLFPQYRDENGERKSTGQKFVTVNNSKINHNVKIEGQWNEIIPSGKSLEGEIEVSSKPIMISCNIHVWMSAYVLALDHPYAAITGIDGTYKIDNAPIGDEVRILAWHEKAGFLNENGGAGEQIKVEARSVKNFKCKAK
jgi:hypothetical protein